MTDPITTGPTGVGDPALTVRLFGSLREGAGWNERRVPLPASPASPTPAQLWRQLGLENALAWKRGPSAGAIPPQIRIAINHSFGDPERILAAGDEVAFLPPISGG